MKLKSEPQEQQQLFQISDPPRSTEMLTCTFPFCWFFIMGRGPIPGWGGTPVPRLGSEETADVLGCDFLGEHRMMWDRARSSVRTLEQSGQERPLPWAALMAATCPNVWPEWMGKISTHLALTFNSRLYAETRGQLNWRTILNCILILHLLMTVKWLLILLRFPFKRALQT